MANVRFNTDLAFIGEMTPDDSFGRDYNKKAFLKERLKRRS